ncbi:MAG: four helix bundle protein [Bacteroidales bacterium]
MRNFRSLNVWKNGIELVKIVYRLSVLLPEEEKFGIKSQICRAAVSVPSNIAEGCSRSSELEYKRFLEIATGSLFEIETLLVIIQELEFINAEKISQVIEQVQTEQKMVNNLISRIKVNI